MKRWLASWIVTLFLLGAGGRAACLVFRDTRLAVESAHWVAGDATVDRACIVKHHGRRGSSEYEPRVEYRYSVNGRDYVGSRLEIPTRRYPQSYSREKIAGLVPGATIRILYDPDDPAESVIEKPSVDWFHILVPGSISLVFIALGLFRLLPSSKPDRGTREPRQGKGRVRRQRSPPEVAEVTTAD